MKGGIVFNIWLTIKDVCGVLSGAFKEDPKGCWQVTFAIFLMFGGLVFGLYVGFWWCFILGIVQIVEAVKVVGGADGMGIALGLLRIIFSIPIGIFTALILINLGNKVLK